MFDSIEALSLVVLAILPGFVAHLIYRAVLPRAIASSQELLLLSLAFGTMNAALHFWWIIPIAMDPNEPMATWIHCHPFRSASGGLMYLLISPVAIGYLPALIRKKIPLPGFMDPHPAAWDSYFSRKPACVVSAKLKDGTRVAGLYSRETGGYASSFPDPQSLYCGKVFPIDEEGTIIGPPNEHSRGIIIRADDCLILEFIAVPYDDMNSLWGKREEQDESESS